MRGGALATVSGPRIGTELRLLAAEPDPVAAFVSLADLGVDAGGRRPGSASATRPEPSWPRALALLPADGHPATSCWRRRLWTSRRPRLAALLDALGFTAAPP